MSALTNYFTDIGMNCHIRLRVVSGLEETLSDCLQHVVLNNVCFFVLTIFSFPVFRFARHFRLSFCKKFLLRHCILHLYNIVIPIIKFSNICKPEEGWYGQPKYCYVKTIHVVLISFVVVFGLLVFWFLIFWLIRYLF